MFFVPKNFDPPRNWLSMAGLIPVRREISAGLTPQFRTYSRNCSDKANFDFRFFTMPLILGVTFPKVNTAIAYFVLPAIHASISLGL